MASIATSMASLSLANAAATRRAGKPAVALSSRRAVAAQPLVASRSGVAAGRGSLQVFARSPRGNSGGSRKGLMQFVERVNAPQVKDDLIPFRVGMTVRVGVTVVEGNKTRVQPYEGIIIGIHRAGVATTITVRKAFQGYGVERIFPIHSPLCTFEEVRGAGKPVVSTPSFASLIRFFTAGFATDAWARVLSRVSIVPAGAPRSTDRARAPCRAAPPLEKPKPCDLLRKKIFLPPNRRALTALLSFSFSQVRRAKLYYLRNRIGKQAKLKTRFVAKKTGPTRHQIKMEALAATKAEAAAAAEAEAAAAAAAEAAAAAAAEAAAAPAEEEAAAEPEA